MDHTPTLTGRLVELEPLDRSHVDALADAARCDRSSFALASVPASHADVARHVDGLLDLRDRGGCVPFVQRRLADDVIVGMTRYVELLRWSGRDEPDEVEVGGTWLTPDAQGTGLNVEAKLLLLTHAFETWRTVRVAIKTDARNARSREAIERLGAPFEGILRNHRWSAVVGEEGLPRDTALFAITDADWPAVRARLRARLARHPSGPSAAV